MSKLSDLLKKAEAAVVGEAEAVEAAVVAEVVKIEAVAKRTFQSLSAEFDALVEDVRKLEAHLGFSPKA